MARTLCKDLMQQEPIALQEHETCYRAAQLMHSQGVGFLPVIDRQRRLVGVVTDRDLVVRGMARRGNGQTPITQVMTREVISCRPMEDLYSAERRMAENRKSRIPVVDDFGECVGIISLSDIAQTDSPGVSGEILGRVTQRESRAAMH